MRKLFGGYLPGSLLLIFLAMLLSMCGGGGGGGGENPSNLAGEWDALQLDTGNAYGWLRANATIDGSGNIFINNSTDSNGVAYPGPPQPPLDIQTKWVVDGSGTIREYDTSSSPNVLNPSLYGHLASNKRFIVATDSPELFTYSLIVLRKRDASVTFSDGDIRGKSFSYHQLYGGPDNVWTYGSGSIDSLGSVTIDNVVWPSGPLSGYPIVGFTNLVVDSAGIVTNPPANDFYGWLTNDKNTIFGLIDDPVGHSMYQFIVMQFLGHTYAQADLAGTWRFNVLYGWNAPGWLKGTWTIDSAGTGTYDAATYLTDMGSTVPPITPEVLTLATDGIITNSVTSTYHGMLSAGGDLYVRTRTSGGASHRYSIGISVK